MRIIIDGLQNKDKIFLILGRSQDKILQIISLYLFIILGVKDMIILVQPHHLLLPSSDVIATCETSSRYWSTKPVLRALEETIMKVFDVGHDSQIIFQLLLSAQFPHGSHKILRNLFFPIFLCIFLFFGRMKKFDDGIFHIIQDGW